MSFGIIGVSPPTLKIANGVQKINKVHTYNQTVSQELNMYNSENYMCVADLMINMDRPRIIVTACKNVKDVRPTLTRVLEWSDPEDTIINCTHEHYKHSMYYENECSNKNIHYLSASLTNDAFLVGGQDRVFKSHEPLFYSFAKNVQHTGDMPGSGHFAKMVLDGLECAMFQIVGDAFAYCNGNVPVMLSLMDKAKNMDVSGPVIDRCKSQLYVTRNYSQVAQVKNSTTWFMEYTFKARLPTPVIHSAITSRMTSQYAKLSETHQSYNTFYDTNVILQTIRFCFAMALYEGNQISYGKIVHWSKNSNVACRMFETHDPLYVMDATVEFARTFVMHCVNSGVPIPTVQAALSQYDFMKQERTSMNFIASLRDV